MREERGSLSQGSERRAPIAPQAAVAEGFVGAEPWGGSSDTSLMLKDLYLCALPSSKVFLNGVSFWAATRLLFCCVAMEMLLVCPPQVLQPVSTTSLPFGDQ